MAKTSLDEYNVGLDFFKKHRIKSVQFNQGKRTFTATVQDAKLQTLQLRFNRDGKLTEAECTCKTENNINGCCRHMVAVMLLIHEKDEQGFFRELHFRQAARDIFNFFSEKHSVSKTPVCLEPTLEVSKSEGGRSILTALKLRIGQDRFYVVRSIKRLLLYMENNLDLDFGKKFTFSPSRHEFRGRDSDLVNLLRDIYETEKLIESLSHGHSNTGIFKDDRVYLTDTSLKRFLKIYEDAEFKAVILNEAYDSMSIKSEDIPVNFLLAKEGNDLVLNIDFEGSMLPLTGDGEYFYCNGQIYRVSEQQSENLKPFYMAMMYQKSRKLRFIEEDRQRFVSEILPFAEKAGKLEISEQLQAEIENIPLTAEVYLDYERSNIVAEIRFVYGEHIINPFLPEIKSPKFSDKLLIRDIKTEEAILDILDRAEFTVREGKVHLSGEDNIYDFIFTYVPQLQDYATVYYSENLRNFKLKQSVPFSAQFRLNRDNGLLDISFSTEGIDNSELVEILSAFRKKKKYYRLKDGSFINLNSGELAKIFDFMDRIAADPEELASGSIKLPIYRAPYLDQSVRELGMRSIERNAAFKEFVQNIMEPGDMTFAIPEGLKGSLRDYQKFGFKWLKTLDYYKLGGILADDMGLGKTFQIIALLLSAKAEYGPKPSLVIVPTSLVFNWCAELDKFAPDLKYVTVTGDKNTRLSIIEKLNEYDVAITSYPLFRRDVELYAPYCFRYCILDEAQHIKNPLSRNAHSVKQIKAESRFALTGTPIENNLYELWSVFDFILPGYLHSYRHFNEKYVQPSTSDDDCDVLNDLKMQIRPFVLRRLKKEVLNELPEKIENTIMVELTEEQKKLYMAYLEHFRGEIGREIEQSGFEKNKLRVLAALTRLRQLCCHPALFIEDYKGESAKMQLLEELLQESIEGGHRILLFSQFTEMLQIIRRKLEDMKIPALYLDGSTPASERGYLVHSFNEGTGKVFLISLKAGGYGLNLTGADTVIHFDPWWNPAVENQATDRAYRIGQKKSVYVIKLITKGTIEEKILSLQEKKRNLADTVIQPGETLLSKMTPEEIRALFE